MTTSATLLKTESADVPFGRATVAWFPLDTYTLTPVITVNGTVNATFGVTETKDSLQGATGVSLNAGLIKTESVDTIVAGLTSSASMTVAALLKTETGDTLYGSMSNWQPLDTYTLTPVITLNGTVNATLTVTQSPDTIVAGANLTTAGVNATFTVTETRDSVVAGATQGSTHPVGVISRMGFFGYGERRDGSFAGRLAALNAGFTVTETSDSLAATSVEAIAASLIKTESNDLATTAAAVAISGSVAISETGDTLGGNAVTVIGVNADLNLTESTDSIVAGATQQGMTTGSLVITEAGDTSTGTVTGGTPIIVVSTGGPGASRSRGKKLRILPDKTRLYATEDEVRQILATFYKKKTLDDVKLQPKQVQELVKAAPDVALVQFDKYVPKVYKLNTEKRMVQADYAQFLTSLKQREEEDKFLKMIMDLL